MESRVAILAKLKLPSRPAERSQVTICPVNVDRFCERVSEYKATVIRTDSQNVQKEIQKLTSVMRAVIAPDLPPEFRTDNMTEDALFKAHELDSFDVAVTTCALAIEETGTIILDCGKGQGRRALSLVPDRHICIVYENQIRKTVHEAVIALHEPVKNGQPLTFISGPSATSDIELVRVEGVHGPRHLTVLLITE